MTSNSSRGPASSPSRRTALSSPAASGLLSRSSAADAVPRGARPDTGRRGCMDARLWAGSCKRSGGREALKVCEAITGAGGK
ncbi:hypothetical protein DL768_004557 [Monosporascus sp. mg162]|nr:hypothetical protein DL768_004557 [Monosporascus sp. mg162]